MKKTAIISLALLLAACSSSNEYQTEVTSESHQEEYQTEQVVSEVSETEGALEKAEASVEEVAKQTAAQTETDVTVSNAPSKGFAIQLATLSDHDKAVKFAKNLRTDLPLWIQTKTVSKKQLYAVLIGDYEDYEHTKSTVDALPEEFQKLKPFVKNFTDKELADAQSFELIHRYQ